MTPGVDDLTDRERDVLRLLLAGHTAKTAASALDLSVHTVNDYLRDARKKLGVTSSREAARILGEAERDTPKILGHSELGISQSPATSHNPSITTDQPAVQKRGGWIIGGIVMLAIAAAVAFLAASTTGSEKPAGEDAAMVAQQDKAAEQAALGWVTLIDQGSWKDSWAAAGTLFRGAITADGWATKVEPVRAPLGKVETRRLHDVKAYAELPGAPEGEYRIVTFTTDFAKAPASVETVVMAREASGWKVVGYYIR